VEPEVVLEHASGKIDVLVDFSNDQEFNVNSAGLVRTARKLADGHVYVPESVWNDS
jgi:2-methylaconitate cis-trans-isomerase PrpF